MIRAEARRSDLSSTDARARADRFVGVVLCGGKSRRMGSDKALLTVGSESLLARTVATLHQLTPRVVLACGESQRYGEFGIPRVLDRYAGAGPLAGLEAALAATEEEWLLVLACDLPRMRADVLAQLVERAASADLDACFFETERGLEPLCAVYRRACWTSVRAALDAGERKMIAFLRYPTDAGALPRQGTVRADAFADCLVNVNSPQDWSALTAPTEEP